MERIAHFFKYFDFPKAFVTSDDMIFGVEGNAAAHAANLDPKKREFKTYDRESEEVQQAIAEYDKKLKAEAKSSDDEKKAELLKSLEATANTQVEDAFKETKLTGEELEKAKAAELKKVFSKLKKEAGL